METGTNPQPSSGSSGSAGRGSATGVTEPEDALRKVLREGLGKKCGIEENQTLNLSGELGHTKYQLGKTNRGMDVVIHMSRFIGGKSKGCPLGCIG